MEQKSVDAGPINTLMHRSLQAPGISFGASVKLVIERIKNKDSNLEA